MTNQRRSNGNGRIGVALTKGRSQPCGFGRTHGRDLDPPSNRRTVRMSVPTSRAPRTELRPMQCSQRPPQTVWPCCPHSGIRAPYANPWRHVTFTPAEPYFTLSTGMWREEVLCGLTRTQQWLFMRGLGHMAELALPGYLPAAEVAAIDGTLTNADALVNAGIWAWDGTTYVYVEWFGSGIGILRPYDRRQRAPIPRGLRHRVYDRDGHRCRHCGTDKYLTLDHVHPWSLNGPDTFENLQTLCRSCNSRKGARV